MTSVVRPVARSVARAVAGLGKPLPPTFRIYERGIALAGMEFDGNKIIPGAEGTDYFKTDARDVAYFGGKRFTIARIGYLWERFQPTINGPFDPVFKGYIDAAIAQCKANRMLVILDNHNYGGRQVNGVARKLGTTELPISALADFYSRLAAVYKDEPWVFGYDVMNEPINMPVECSVGTYNTAVSTIQMVPNWKLEKDRLDWTFDGVFSYTSDPAYNGGAPTMKLVAKTAGNYDNFTTANDAEHAMRLKPNTDYVWSMFYRAAFTGNYPQVQLGEGSPYPTTPLASGRVTAAAGRTRFSVPFRTGATGLTYMRVQNLGGVGEMPFGEFNITEGATLQPYRDHCHYGAYATTTLMNQAAIDAIRAAGSKQWIWIETDRFSAPHQFRTNYGSNPVKWWNDPLNKTALSFHYYLDPDHSGTYKAVWTAACRARIQGDLKPPLDWAVSKGVVVTFGEVGAPSDDTSSGANYRQDLETVYADYLDAYGLTAIYYAGGRQFESAITIQPPGNDYTKDRAVMAVAARHLAP